MGSLYQLPLNRFETYSQLEIDFFISHKSTFQNTFLQETKTSTSNFVSQHFRQKIDKIKNQYITLYNLLRTYYII